MTYLLRHPASSRCRVKSPFKSRGTRLTFPLMQKSLSVGSSYSCQTFTMSRRLPTGCGLLRWLGRPLRTLAFSRLSKTVQRFRHSPVPVRMTYQRPLAAYYTPEEVWHNRLTVQEQPPLSSYLLVQVCQPLTPVYIHDASNICFSRQHRSQGWSVNRRVVGRSRTFVRRLRTPTSAARGRTLRSPDVIVQTALLRSNHAYR